MGSNPKHYESMNNLGGILINLNKNKEAIRILKKAIRITSSKPGIYYNLGLAYHHLDNMDVAIHNYLKEEHLR